MSSSMLENFVQAVKHWQNPNQFSYTGKLPVDFKRAADFLLIFSVH